MQSIKKFILLMLPILMMISCANVKGTTINGNVKGAENMTVYLESMSLTSAPNALLTGNVGADGTFKLTLPDGMKAGVYRIRIGEQVVDILSDGTEKKIELTGNLSEFNNFGYGIMGSPLSEQYLQAVKDYIAKKMDVAALTTLVSEKADPLVAYQVAARIFTFRPEFAGIHKTVSNRLSQKYPNLEIATQYTSVVAQLEQATAMETAQSKIKVGQPAPEISLPGPDGKIRKLSSYKGKVVLIDFWASWCGPCRKANPHVVQIYDKYKSKGFDVFSVSLDGVDSNTAKRFDEAQLKEQMEGSKQRWLGAIAQDQLKWDGHVSDLKKWECAPAGEYGVRSIPQTFLVGKDGNIVAINPRNDLEEQILKFL